ncbi:formyltetrahydrofolate deformylase [Seinonella peptonophila]|uniref:Formyltetrahydrofolate deformylase n=1 Tax=Seinonella peptonophila TaxID=112248 RepID=A0A1M4XIQ4_9BACL|nr:formyltetrahydrofolate deformylase [Seinonella peptonophila]SHE93434.1 formyltetrahydrofolate deformylase [Seinonella peptonophila]
MKQTDIGRMRISCPDQPGIVAKVSRFLYEEGANIIHSDQHTEIEKKRFFMRVEFQLPSLAQRLDQVRSKFEPLATEQQMDWQIALAAHRQRLAIFVSREDHCLRELLWRWQIGELDADIRMVVSNHPIWQETVEQLGIPYYHLPVNKENRDQVTEQHLQLLAENQIETVVLARYMQILPPAFVQAYQQQIINIHHSFLPAFIGANPYHQAYDRGVKLIGATAHYVTEELDQGPIIEQDVYRVNHRHDAEELKRLGRDLERIVLARAVQWHLSDQVIVEGNKTIVFPG